MSSSPVPRVDTLDELNKLLLDKCKVYADTHKIPGRESPVKDLLLEDQKRLCPLPVSPFDASKAAVCRVTPLSVVRFAANDYSVPVKYVGQEVTVRAYAEQIRIFAKGELIAEHTRNYGQNQQILKLAHYLPLLEYKPRGILEAKPVRQNLSASPCCSSWKQMLSAVNSWLRFCGYVLPTERTLLGAQGAVHDFWQESTYLYRSGKGAADRSFYV